jgi:hypothetical protein
VGRLAIACSVFFILSAVSTSGAEFPARKAGLWEITIAGAHAFTVRQCSDAATDEAMEQTVFGVAGDCAKRDVQKSGSMITVVSVCKSARKTMISHVVITGSLDSEYSMTLTKQSPGRSGGPSMTLSAKWLGPCGAGQRPGDVIMLNGTKFNILDLPKGSDSAAR